ncbi:hypothetical protein PILCRDRAFT_585318 [Piloderma croceum F 1598]|uniref:Uncharacterized protein n=1 Tax=Piloderma croceum (strain F 1598) TaxID=765440 RepID=A0A0C3AX80_PILCF|nr:hypothetical protein PILCRDRAFT_585318 [Piloderma croceum F 1598]
MCESELGGVDDVRAIMPRLDGLQLIYSALGQHVPKVCLCRPAKNVSPTQSLSTNATTTIWASRKRKNVSRSDIVFRLVWSPVMSSEAGPSLFDMIHDSIASAKSGMVNSIPEYSIFMVRSMGISCCVVEFSGSRRYANCAKKDVVMHSEAHHRRSSCTSDRHVRRIWIILSSNGGSESCKDRFASEH